MSASEPHAGDRSPERDAAERGAAEAPRDSDAGLVPFRRRLDELDEQIAWLLGERFRVCREIAFYKREHEIPMMQPDRVAEVRSRYLARGADVDLPSDFSADLFELLIGATCRMEDELIGAAAAPGTPPRGGRRCRRLARKGKAQSGRRHDATHVHHARAIGHLPRERAAALPRAPGLSPTSRSCSSTICSRPRPGPWPPEHVPRAVQRTRAGPSCHRALPHRGVRGRHVPVPHQGAGAARAHRVAQPRSLGIVSATRGYTRPEPWARSSTSPPSRSSARICSRALRCRPDPRALRREHPTSCACGVYGAVDTTWVVYGAHKRFRGDVIGQRTPWLFTGDPEPTGERDLGRAAPPSVTGVGLRVRRGRSDSHSLSATPFARGAGVPGRCNRQRARHGGRALLSLERPSAPRPPGRGCEDRR